MTAAKRLSSEAALRIISKAWGKNRGYVFFPHIDREAQEKSGLRRAGYHETAGFKWPKDKDKILAHMDAHRDHDLYWCPSVFEYNERKTEYAMDERALWADLDEVDPREIDSNYRPSIAWETSPGRYQALWIIVNGDMQGASWPGGENQKLTYYVGADKSGWDTTQLLRIPGWKNHKVEYRKNGQPASGKLLWGPQGNYQPNDFEDLPEVEGALETYQITDALEEEIATLDRHEVIARVKLKLNKRARDILYARAAAGDRSDNMWYLTRCLADAGCKVAEIVAVVKETVWNKFDGRADELKRLITEATKAIAQRSEEVSEALEEEQAPKASPTRLAAFLADVKKPEWLIDGIATKGSVGFIAGEPKSFKSWVALDMALSIATGARFLDHFQVVQPGPVLYIQEEDSAITVKSRTRKIWKGKAVDRIKLADDRKTVEWHPGNEMEFDPDIAIYLQEGFILSEGHWQEWLDETLANGLEGHPFTMVIIDTLMNVAGEVDENKAQQMTTRVFKPLKVLARKHEVAVRLVHHMRKAGQNDSSRGGQKMLGSVANHAWSEDSLYLGRGKEGLRMEFESKSAPEKQYTIVGLEDSWDWQPLFMPEGDSTQGQVKSAGGRPKKREGELTPYQQQLVDVIAQGGAWGTQAIADEVGKSYNSVYRTMKTLYASHRVHREDKQWTLPVVVNLPRQRG